MLGALLAGILGLNPGVVMWVVSLFGLSSSFMNTQEVRYDGDRDMTLMDDGLTEVEGEQVGPAFPRQWSACKIRREQELCSATRKMRSVGFTALFTGHNR